jgi:hypothetical protein
MGEREEPLFDRQELLAGMGRTAQLLFKDTIFTPGRMYAARPFPLAWVLHGSESKQTPIIWKTNPDARDPITLNGREAYYAGGSLRQAVHPGQSLLARLQREGAQRSVKPPALEDGFLHLELTEYREAHVRWGRARVADSTAAYQLTAAVPSLDRQGQLIVLEEYIFNEGGLLYASDAAPEDAFAQDHGLQRAGYQLVQLARAFYPMA